MSDLEKRDGSDAGEEASISRLMRLAGRRRSAPDEVEARVYSRVLEAWESATGRPDPSRVYARVRRSWALAGFTSRLRSLAVPLAVAASVAVAVAVLLWRQPESPSLLPQPVATVVRVNGDAATLPPPGSDILPGAILSTGPGQGIGVILAGNRSLRIDADSRVRIESGNRLRVEEGRVYVDSGDLMFSDNRVRVVTPLAEVTDVGTQFLVGVAPGALEVAVREGRVDIEQAGATRIAVAGERLTLDARGTAAVEAIAAHDGYWRWASELAAPFEIEDRSLLEFLRWAARETGRELVFEDQELRLSAMRTDLHGTIAGIEPLQAIRSVLATTRFNYSIEDGRIVIRR